MKVATDRWPLGPRDREGVRVVATPLDPSPYSYLGLEPVSARLGNPDRPRSVVEERTWAKQKRT